MMTSKSNAASSHHDARHGERHGERGNMLLIILLAVVLIGVLTAAITNSGGSDGANIDSETLLIRVSEVQRYASELERAVLYIVQNGVSESDMRFAHPDAPSDYGDLSADTDPSDQVFHRLGGGAKYRTPPAGVNDGSSWEFYGSTAIPGAGSSEADLVAVLPNVTEAFCEKINEINGQTGSPYDPSITVGGATRPCIHAGDLGRFDDAQQYYTGNDINQVSEATFTQDPNISAARTALEACVECQTDGAYHYYHVLMAR